MKKKLTTKIFIALLITIMLLIIHSGTAIYAASGHAFCAGYVENGGLNATTAITNANSVYKSMGYNTQYVLSPSFSTLQSGKFSDGTKYLESKVILLFGHGSDHGQYLLLSTAYTGIKVGNSDNLRVGINNINFNNVRLITLAGCETSYADNSLAVEIYRRGADNVVGWKQTVYVNSIKDWLSNYNSKLKSGASVWDAVAYANQFSYNDSRVKDIGFFGDHGNTISSANLPVAFSKSNTASKINTKDVLEDISFTNSNSDLKELYTYLNKKYPSFNEEEYDTKVYEINKEQGLYTIDLIRKINGYYTDLGYVVTVTNGKIQSITDNNKVVNENELTLTKKKYISSNKLNEYKQDVANQIIRNSRENDLNPIFNNNDITITKQETQLYLDVNTNKQYYKIFTTYKNSEGALDVDYSLIEI